jgi:Leucine-rich repeat (LRR) protein
MRKSLLLAVLVLFSISYAHAQIPAIERAALIALYDATNGPGWTDNSGWVTATVGTECTWYGVACVADLVNSLHLENNQLSGSIPPELGNLSRLWYLFMDRNQLTGSIPPELGNLSYLANLYLNNNQLSGSIPPELGNTNLAYTLSLANNLLTGSIPPELGDLVGLDQLYLQNNQLTGSIPPELGNITRLQYLDLSANQLTGSIPPELGNLAFLKRLLLQTNHLSGSIPPQLGDLSSLVFLQLEYNQLSGSIPPELENLSSLNWMYLHSNQLSGSIPPELGNLPNMYVLTLNSNQLSGAIPAGLGNSTILSQLDLNSNQLSGDIPVELGDLPLWDVNGLDLQWNALHSDNDTLITFLNAKHMGGVDWQSTQTIAPENLTVGSLGDHTVWLSWDAVSYQSDTGGYEVFSAPTGTGVWTSSGWTEAKTDTTHPVTGLDPGKIYDLAMLTFTDPHVDNLNLVHSDFSLQVMATTTSGGCAQPIIEQVGEDPITLSVSGSYLTYLWKTAETTSSIVVDPQLWQWYWVTVTSAGSCEETAATWVGPEVPIFTDGFESGDTSEWSSKVP